MGMCVANLAAGGFVYAIGKRSAEKANNSGTSLQ